MEGIIQIKNANRESCPERTAQPPCPLIYVQIAVAVLILGLSSCKGAEGSYPAPALGVTIGERFQVLDIKKGSAAEEAGIQIGDILLGLDGKTNLAPDEWVEILGGMEVGDLSP